MFENVTILLVVSTAVTMFGDPSSNCPLANVIAIPIRIPVVLVTTTDRSSPSVFCDKVVVIELNEAPLVTA